MNIGLADVLGPSREYNERMDCAVVMGAVAANVPYEDAHAAFELAGRKPRNRTPWPVLHRAMDILDVRLIPVPVPKKVKTPITLEKWAKKNPGTYVAYVRGHIFAVKDGKVEDWSAGRRHRITHFWEVDKAA